jgi:hypothetical protein
MHALWLTPNIRRMALERSTRETAMRHLAFGSGLE